MKRQSFVFILAAMAALSFGFMGRLGVSEAADPTLSVSCSTTGSATTFQHISDPTGVKWNIDLSVTDEGFQLGTYLESQLIPSSATSFRWDQMSTGPYYFRINEQRSDGFWYTTATYMFEIDGCSPAHASGPYLMHPSYDIQAAPGVIPISFQAPFFGPVTPYGVAPY